MNKHNHITRDIKPLGACPRCDEYHNRNIPQVSNENKDAKIAELETYLDNYKNNNDLFEEAIRLPFKKREDKLS